MQLVNVSAIHGGDIPGSLKHEPDPVVASRPLPISLFSYNSFETKNGPFAAVFDLPTTRTKPVRSPANTSELRRQCYRFSGFGYHLPYLGQKSCSSSPSNYRDLLYTQLSPRDGEHREG